MLPFYVKVHDGSLDIVTHGYIQTTHAKYKAVPFTADELADIGYALLDESAVVGYRPSGKAVKVGNIYQREYVDQTEAQRLLRLEHDLANTDTNMARMVEDIWDVLVLKGVVSDSDLPAAALEKLTDRRLKRGAMQ